MKELITLTYTVEDIKNQINNGTAKCVESASFLNENKEYSVFFRLWGSVVNMVTSLATKETNFYFVKDSDKEMFNAIHH